MRRLEDYEGNKYGKKYRSVIKNHKKNYQVTYGRNYDDTFEFYKENSIRFFPVRIEYFITVQSIKYPFDNICRKLGSIFRDSNQKFLRRKESLCNTLISHSKIFYEQDQKRYDNELFSDIGRHK